MDYLALKNELQIDPQGIGYVPFLASSPGIVVNLINAPTASMVRERYVTVRTMLAELGVAGAVIAEKLSGFAALAPLADPNAEGLRIATKWAMRFIDSDGQGLDVGHPNTQGMVDALAAGGVLTTAEANSLKALALQPASRAEVLFGAGTSITEADVRAALAA